MKSSASILIFGRHYEFLEREPGAAPYLARSTHSIFRRFVSMDPHSTSISGHKYSVPRVVRGITRSLFLEQQHRIMDDIHAYREREIVWPLPSARNSQSDAAE
jgi:hypothetical protein